MAKWNCYARVVGSKYLGTVEAETEKEAEIKAWALEEAWISFCHQCAHQCEDPEIDKLTVERED